MQSYLLMRGTTSVLSFHTERDMFDEVDAIEDLWLSQTRPLGYHDLTSFLERRKAPKHRKHIEQLLERYDCLDLDGFLRVTHALSLNDTYWVKEENSSLTWEEVNLYENQFDELVSLAAFDGQISSTVLSSTSPEFGTDGYYAKCWVRESDGIYLYKGGSNHFEIEPLSEYLASQLAERICPECVRYDLAIYHNRLISRCRLFTSEQEGLVKCSDLLPREKHSVRGLLAFFEEIDSGDAFRRMCILDALTLNVDRHYGNFGVMVDNQSTRILRMAPVYDNNRCLLFDMDADQLEKRLDWCVRRCKPAFGTSFVATARGLLTDGIRRDLEELRTFRFAQHGKIEADGKRLEILSAVVQNQARQILEG